MRNFKGKKVSDLATLGERIRAARKARQWSQENLAYEAGLDRSYVGGIERGERNISVMSLCRIAKALGMDIASLTRGIPESKNESAIGR